MVTFWYLLLFVLLLSVNIFFDVLLFHESVGSILRLIFWEEAKTGRSFVFVALLVGLLSTIRTDYKRIREKQNKQQQSHS
ncbi:hypothetical protein GCM10023228_14920 [Brevibacillus fulvus]|uniref:Uncharacterized protein n=1 Tax=Brevibacillus fulvus TaxID=1125967 RepID=A0A938XVJ5_9BACL|nr:hypothetical protein [Brevibacillus fulvus]